MNAHEDNTQAWRKVMAAYRWGNNLPVHRDQLRAQRHNEYGRTLHLPLSVMYIYEIFTLNIMNDVTVV